MPTLPTLTVTQVQADYLLGAFGTPEAYKAWLLTQIKSYVMNLELAKARADANTYVEQKRVALEASLAGIT